MHVSVETAEQTRSRLHRVIATAQLQVLPQAYAYVETPASQFPSPHLASAIALVRDEQVWSALVPADDDAGERYVVFSFHFAPDLDNSGFVGWLASHLKAIVGTGVLVVCGHNRARGGIFDYWGAPESMAAPVLAEVRKLRAAGSAG